MSDGLRVAVTGATGNIGTSVVQELSREPRVASILGIARRDTSWRVPKLDIRAIDIADPGSGDELERAFDGCDVVIHLAWLFQPTRDPVATWQTNVIGGMRVFDAAARAAVPALVYSSSVGAYSPGPDGEPVTESWPTHGWPGAAYTREKAYLERALDSVERDNPGTRVVRMRPAFVFKQTSAAEQRRLFAGPLLPGKLVQRKYIPLVPDIAGLRLQTVHGSDVADAFRIAAVTEARGAYNIAADPVIDSATIADLLGARSVPLPAGPLRALLSAAWHAHVVPVSPGLFDAVLRLPVMDTTRARVDLGWAPRYSATEALEDFFDGLSEGHGMSTPPLQPAGPVDRLREFSDAARDRA